MSFTQTAVSHDGEVRENAKFSPTFTRITWTVCAVCAAAGPTAQSLAVQQLATGAPSVCGVGL